MIPAVVAFDLPSDMGKLEIKEMSAKIMNPFKDTRSLRYAFRLTGD